MSIKYLDIFCGAGGMSEGFERVGYEPVAHIDIDEAACYTLKTRMAYKWLKKNGYVSIYKDYISESISRDTLYSKVPKKVIDSVICEGISKKTLPLLFQQIDNALDGSKLDLIIGGPPCQAYSVAGRARDNNGMLDDDRNYLYRYYTNFLEKYQPKYFVFENVLGLLSAKDKNDKKYFEVMQRAFERVGYSIDYQILNANDYGVPQKRKRIILVGKLGKFDNVYPKIQKTNCRYLINQLIEDLPQIEAGAGTPSVSYSNLSNKNLLQKLNIFSDDDLLTGHWARPNNERDLKIYKAVVNTWNNKNTRLIYNNLPKELITHANLKSFQDRYKVLAGDLEYCQTVVAHLAKDGHYYIHPDIKQNRSITPREAARLQTFPDDYYFESANGKPARTAAFKQIGNAVPVLLAEKIARALKKENWNE
jgi:DNA (cytosine-5)-methyltransferase 1